MHNYIACAGCDLLIDLAGVRDGDTAHCGRCGSLLTRRMDSAAERGLALAVAALLLLGLACGFPFLALEVGDQNTVISLWETPRTLWKDELYPLAALVAAFIIGIPALVLVMAAIVCVLLRRRRNDPALVPMARWLFLGQSWAMMEVFIIGVIVSLVKLMKMATVALDTAFFAYIGFTVCFLLTINSLDRYQCWRDIGRLQRAGPGA